MNNRPAYMTRKEAAAHLRCSVDTVDRMLVAMSDGQERGKLRYLMAPINRVTRVRILAADVFAILPQQEAA